MPNTLSEATAAEIRAEMARKKLKVVDLAGALNVSPKVASALLNGQAKIDLNRLQEIAAFLGCDWIDLMRSTSSALAS